MPTGSPTRQETFLYKNSVLRAYTLTIWSAAEKANNKVHGRKEKENFFLKKLLVFLKKVLGK